MRIRGLALIPAVLAACQSWQPLAHPTAGVNLEGNPDMVRVTQTQGCGPPSRECVGNRGTVTLYTPRIQGDSLIGYYDKNQRERAALAVTDITIVAVRRINKARTNSVLGGTVATSVVVIMVGIIAMLISMDDGA